MTDGTKWCFTWSVVQLSILRVGGASRSEDVEYRLHRSYSWQSYILKNGQVILLGVLLRGLPPLAQEATLWKKYHPFSIARYVRLREVFLQLS